MENNTKNIGQISTPQAIIIAGALIMLAIFITQGKKAEAPKTLSEQIKVSKDQMSACLKDLNLDTLQKNIQDSVTQAMQAVPENQRGTPYSVVIGKDGVKADIRGAESYENTKVIVDAVLAGIVTNPYKGDVPPPNVGDHVYGNINAVVTIIEYSDFECPFCKRYQPILKRIVDESNGNVRWIYRHWPLHQHSFEKLAAAECVAQIKGNNAFWEYSELLFGLLKTEDESVAEQL